MEIRMKLDCDGYFRRFNVDTAALEGSENAMDYLRSIFRSAEAKYMNNRLYWFDDSIKESPVDHRLNELVLGDKIALTTDADVRAMIAYAKQPAKWLGLTIRLCYEQGYVPT